MTVRAWYVTGDLARAASVAREVAPLGVDVQLRAPRTAHDDDVRALALELREVTRRAGVRFVVNRRLALARAVGADGVHVSSNDVADVRAAWPTALVSAPCHDARELEQALEGGAGVVLVSPIFATPGEGKAPPRGVAALADARAAIARRAWHVGTPRTELVALGGITLENVASCLVHADGFAAIRLFEHALDAPAVRALLARTEGS